jgi:hypothetical protein
VPGPKLLRLVKENVTVTGEVVAVPEVKEAVSQLGIPEMEKSTLLNVEVS